MKRPDLQIFPPATQMEAAPANNRFGTNSVRVAVIIDVIT